MRSVSGLLDSARTILDTAADAERTGAEPTDWTIFFGPDGNLEMIAGLDNSLDSLTWSRGARMAWQVRHLNGGIQVEGRAARERCRLGADSPQLAAHMLLGTTGLYELRTAA